MTTPASNAPAFDGRRRAWGAPTAWLRHRLDSHRATKATGLDERSLGESAIIFAPHYDDETLGCGGLIIRKRQSGADCRIVFMTDGSASHGARADGKSLAELRLLEAVSAGRVMGIASDHISTLAFPDQSLGKHFGEAVGRVADILDRFQPKQIWYPHVAEPSIWSRDHPATTKIVRAAAALCGRQPAMFEYPIWLWFGYPWIDPAATRRGERRAYLRASLSSAFGFRLARECQLTLDIGDVLETKQTALAEYRSQTGGLADSPSLAKVANGQFLAWLMRPTEIYAVGRPPIPQKHD